MNIVRALKVFFNIKTKGDLIVFAIAMIMANGGGMYLANEAWIEWNLGQELARRGISTQAIVVDCNQAQRYGRVWFEFDARRVDGEVEHYKVRGGFSDWDCITGKPIDIRYLPENPNLARVIGDISYKFLAIVSGISFILLWILGSIDFLKRKHKGEI